MLGSKLARAGSRLRATPSNLFTRRLTAPSPILTKQAAAPFTTTTSNNKPLDPKDKEHAETAGSFARTDATVQVEYPADHELPSSAPITGAGRAGINVRPTLASFSLQGKVGVVTGGARGLGLVMGQGMVISGADLAIVDLNSKKWEKEQNPPPAQT